ncbi:hypothetical protein JCM10296v2_006827 [Rhodotorula toruloides]
MARLTKAAASEYKRTPPSTPKRARAEPPPPPPTTSELVPRGTPILSPASQPEATTSSTRDIPAVFATTREDVAALFGDADQLEQCWPQADPEHYNREEEHALPPEDRSETGEGDDGEDDFEDKLPHLDDVKQAHTAVTGWVEEVVEELFCGDEIHEDVASSRVKAVRIWPIFAEFLASYAPLHLTYLHDHGLQRRPGVASRSVAAPLCEFVDLPTTRHDSLPPSVQRGAVVFTWMYINQPEWHKEFDSLSRDNIDTWSIPFEEVKLKNGSRKMINSDRMGIYTLIDDGGYIGFTFREFWRRILQHLLMPVSYKMAEARSKKALGYWSCLEVFAVPEEDEDTLPHLVLFLVETFWNAITRAAEGKNLNTNKLDWASWAALATRDSIKRGLAKAWELMSEPEPNGNAGQRRLTYPSTQISPGILTQNWLRDNKDTLLPVFGLNAFSSMRNIFRGGKWAWFIRTIDIPFPPEAYPTLRYPTAWMCDELRTRLQREKRARHEDALYDFLQRGVYEAAAASSAKRVKT